MNNVMKVTNNMSDLSKHLLSEIESLSSQDRIPYVQKQMNMVIADAERARHSIDLDTIILINIEDYFNLYKSFPKYLVEQFLDVEAINLDIYLLREMDPYEVWDMIEDEENGSYDPEYLRFRESHDLRFGEILYCEERNEYYICETDTEVRYCSDFEIFISVLESLKYFQNCLHELWMFGSYPKSQIFINQISVVYVDGNSQIFYSMDDFIDEYLTGLKYSYDYSTWREYYV